MIKTILHLFKVHRKVIFGNTSVVIEDMFGVTPKSLNTVDMVLTMVSKGLAVVQPMVLTNPFQGVIASKGVGVIDRSFPGMLSDMSHQFISSHLLYNLGIYPAITLQKPKYNAFTSCASSALALASAAEVGLVNLNLTLKLAGLKLGYMVDRFTQTLVDAGNYLIINAQITCHAIGRLLLVEAGDNTNLFAQTLERFLFSAGLVPALHIAAPSFAYTERTAKYALSTSQKVGRTVENVVSSSNHKDILHPRGYETH